MAKPTDDFARFTKADAPVKNRILAQSAGEVGTLKTSFWLGAPGPTVVLSFDQGLEGVIEEYQDKKDIYVRTYNWVTAPGAEPDQQEAQDLRDQFTEGGAFLLPACRVIPSDNDRYGVFAFLEVVEFRFSSDDFSHLRIGDRLLRLRVHHRLRLSLR